jgi:hypothetical protein
MDIAMDTAAIDLWFPVGDLLPLVEDSLTRGAEHDPRYGDGQPRPGGGAREDRP